VALYSTQKGAGVRVHPRLTHKIARWAAAAALAVGLVAGGIFAHRQWVSSREMRHAPPAVPPSVRQRALKFTFSKMDGRQTVFTIHAARATEYSGGRASLLDDVDIVVNGEHGERHDEIHTRSCGYKPENGAIVCRGAVNLYLSSMPLASRPSGGRVAPPAGRIKIQTRAVTFNRETGTATTDAPVTFRFPEGEGSAEGADYSSRSADFVLRHDVKIRLAAGQAGGVATLVTARGGLTFDRRGNRLRMAGPVEIRRGGGLIDTDQLTVELNDRLRPRRAILNGQTPVRITQGARRDSLQAESAEILFDRQGRAERLNASGRVLALEREPRPIRLQAHHLAIALDPANRQPRMAEAKGDARLEEKGAAGAVRLNAAALRVAMAPAAGGDGVRLVEATAPEGARAQWQSKDESLRLRSRRLRATFDANNQIQLLRGAAGVRMERRQPNQTPVVTTAEELLVSFANGSWTQARESGDVRAAQGARRGRGDQATWLRAEDTLELAGQASASDPGGQVAADRIVWNQKSSELRATGHVRSSYTVRAGPGNGVAGPAGVAPAAGPVNAVAAALDANSRTGQAVYLGSARLWAGDLVVQADRIELQRTERELVATGNVLAAFPQAPLRTRLTGKSGPATGVFHKKPNESGQDSPILWRVKAQRLRYVQGNDVVAEAGHRASLTNQADGKVTLDGDVEAWSSQERIQAKRMVLSLSLGRAVNGRPELWRASGSGGVTVRQAGRWGSAEDASYDAGTGKFVLWGGKPSLRDASGDLVTGDTLTFSVADDTILVESSEGSRTLTRHPVPK